MASVAMRDMGSSCGRARRAIWVRARDVECWRQARGLSNRLSSAQMLQKRYRPASACEAPSVRRYRRARLGGVDRGLASETTLAEHRCGNLMH
jgi:hypothetical protein